MARPCIGCGFVLDDDGDLQIKGRRLAAWPTADWGVLSACNGLRCDPNTGDLYAPPVTRCIASSAASVPINAAVFAAVATWDIDSASLVGANPWRNGLTRDIGTLGTGTLKNVSNCLPMVVQYVWQIGPVYVNIDAGVAVNFNLEVAVDGFPGQTFPVNIFGNTAFPHIDSRAAQTTYFLRPDALQSPPFTTYLAPNATTTFSVRLQGAISGATATLGQTAAVGGGATCKVVGWSHTA